MRSGVHDRAGSMQHAMEIDLLHGCLDRRSAARKPSAVARNCGGQTPDIETTIDAVPIATAAAPSARVRGEHYIHSDDVSDRLRPIPTASGAIEGIRYGALVDLYPTS